MICVNCGGKIHQEMWWSRLHDQPAPVWVHTDGWHDNSGRLWQQGEAACEPDMQTMYAEPS